MRYGWIEQRKACYLDDQIERFLRIGKLLGQGPAPLLSHQNLAGASAIQHCRWLASGGQSGVVSWSSAVTDALERRRLPTAMFSARWAGSEVPGMSSVLS